MSGVAPGSLGAWLVAIRPRTLPAAVAPVVLGTAIATSRGTMALLPALAALAGALLIQVATNLANDYFDHRKGADTEDRLGPTRVVQAGLMPPERVLAGTIGSLLLAAAVGVYLVWVGGWPILLVGLASLALAVLYTGGPFPIAYHGLGEVFVFAFFGLVAVGGTYWVQALALPFDVLLAGAGVGAMSTALLVVNNLRDIEADARAGKRTLAVRLGDVGTRVEYVLVLAVAAVVPLVGWLGLGWSVWTLLALAAFWPVREAADVVLTYIDAQDLNRALAATARGVTWYAGLMSVGFVMGSPLI